MTELKKNPIIDRTDLQNTFGSIDCKADFTFKIRRGNDDKGYQLFITRINGIPYSGKYLAYERNLKRLNKFRNLFLSWNADKIFEFLFAFTG